MKKRRWLFVTDPWNTLDHPNDSTLRIMEAASEQNVKTYFCDIRSLRIQNSKALADVQLLKKSTLRVARRTGTLLNAKMQSVSLQKFDQIHYRVDPPVDLAYLHPLQILDQFAGKQVINPPALLALRSEKTLALELGSHLPISLISSQQSKLLEFVKKHKTVILKPLHHAQSKGIKQLRFGNLQNLNSKIIQATQNFSVPILLQEFLPEVEEKGETRLWFANARLIGWAQKVPKSGEFLINMDQGSTLIKKQLSSKEREMTKLLSKFLQKKKIRLAAIDIIAGKITDFNFTSPGLLVAMEKTLETDLATKVVHQLLKITST